MEKQTTQALTSSNEAPIVSVRSLLDIRKTEPRFKDIEEQARQAWLLKKLAYCNALNHTKQDLEVLRVDAAALDEAMKRDAAVADLTAPEITFAMIHGTMGEYGEYYGLTPRAFMGFFREFLKTDIKYWATTEERKQLAPPKGGWVLERMEHHRKQVQKEWEASQAQEEADTALGIDREAIIKKIKNT